MIITGFYIILGSGGWECDRSEVIHIFSGGGGWRGVGGGWEGGRGKRERYDSLTIKISF